MSGAQPIDGLRPVAPEPSLLTVVDPLRQGRQPSPNSEPAADLPGSDLARPFWRSGVSWRAASCEVGHREAQCLPGGPTRAEKAESDAIDEVTFRPYTLYVPWKCEWVVPGTEGDYGYDQDALSQLEAVTAWNVSQEVWTGSADAGHVDGGINPSLESSASLIGTGGVGASAVWAIGRLLQAYFDGGGGGNPVLHIPVVVVPELQRQGVISQVGGGLRGPVGSRVSPGPGYPVEGAVGPGGEVAAEGEAFMYVTGPVEFDATPPRILNDVQSRHWDRRTNIYELIAERFAIHRFDPCTVFGVLIDVPNAPAFAS